MRYSLVSLKIYSIYNSILFLFTWAAIWAGFSERYINDVLEVSFLFSIGSIIIISIASIFIYALCHSKKRLAIAIVLMLNMCSITLLAFALMHFEIFDRDLHFLYSIIFLNAIATIANFIKILVSQQKLDN